MPLITISYASDRPDADRAKPAVARMATDLARRLLGKREDLTAVRVERVPADDWFVAGRAVAGSGLATYSLEIRVTEGTNTKAEKAAFLAAVHERMERLLGPLEPESYVHVIEARADAYGWAGLSQEFRFVAERMDAAARNALAEEAVARIGIR